MGKRDLSFPKHHNFPGISRELHPYLLQLEASLAQVSETVLRLQRKNEALERRLIALERQARVAE